MCPACDNGVELNPDSIQEHHLSPNESKFDDQSTKASNRCNLYTMIGLDAQRDRSSNAFEFVSRVWSWVFFMQNLIDKTYFRGGKGHDKTTRRWCFWSFSLHDILLTRSC